MRTRDMLLAEETLFRDDEAFNPDYMPDQFRFRDAQLKEMSYALKPALRDGRPGNAFIVGQPATGKTTAVRLVFDELRNATKKVIAVHINCHIQASPYRVFSEIHRYVIGFAPPDTGIPITKVQDDVFKRLSRDKKALVVALDDINYLFASNTANDILYAVLRAYETYPGVRTGVFAIATEELLHKLDDRVRSIFAPSRIEFQPYAKQEIFAILKKRCDAGLYPGVLSDGLLRRIVAQTSDLRYGIETIKQSVLAAEASASRSVKAEHVDKAINMMKLREAKDGATWLLEIIRRHAPVESGDLYSTASREKEISYTTFYRMLQKLKSAKLIEIKPVSKGKGKTSVISAK